MDFDVKKYWAIFSVFDTYLGPTIYYCNPPIDENLGKQITNLMDIATESGFFSYGFGEYNTINICFSVESPGARGRSDLCMISICSTTDIRDLEALRPILEQFVNEMKDFKQVYYALSQKEDPSKYEIFRAQLLDKINRVYNLGLESLSSLRLPPLYLPFKDFNPHSVDLTPFQQIFSSFQIKELLMAFNELEKISTTSKFDDRQQIIYNILVAEFLMEMEKNVEAFNIMKETEQLARNLSDPFLLIDTIIVLTEVQSRIGVIMVLETAVSYLDQMIGATMDLLHQSSEYAEKIEDALSLLENAYKDPHFTLGEPFFTRRKALLLRLKGILFQLFYKKDGNRENLEKSLDLFQKAKLLFDKLPDLRERIIIRASLSHSYEFLELNFQVIRSLNEALLLVENLEENSKPVYEGWLFQRIGFVYFLRGSLNLTQEYLNNSLLKFENLPDHDNIYVGRTYIRFGYVGLYQNERFDESISHLQKAESILTTHSDQIELSRTYYVIGDLYRQKGMFDIAIEYYRKCGDLATNNQDSENIAISFSRLASVYFDQGNYEDSLKNYQKSIEIFSKMTQIQNMGITLGEIGVVYQSMNQFDNALEFYHKALEVFESLGSVVDSYWVLYRIITIYLGSDRSKADEFHARLMSIPYSARNPALEHIGLVVRALFLKDSSKKRDQIRAEVLLEQVLELPTVEHRILFDASLYYSELLLRDYIDYKDPELLEEIENVLLRIEDILVSSSRYRFLPTITKIRIKIFLLRSAYNEAEQALNECLETIGKNASSQISVKCQEDKQYIQQLIEESKSPDSLNLSLIQRIEYLHIENDIEDYLKTSPIF